MHDARFVTALRGVAIRAAQELDVTLQNACNLWKIQLGATIPHLTPSEQIATIQQLLRALLGFRVHKRTHQCWQLRRSLTPLVAVQTKAQQQLNTLCAVAATSSDSTATACAPLCVLTCCAVLPVAQLRALALLTDLLELTSASARVNIIHTCGVVHLSNADVGRETDWVPVDLQVRTAARVLVREFAYDLLNTPPVRKKFGPAGVHQNNKKNRRQRHRDAVSDDIFLQQEAHMQFALRCLATATELCFSVAASSPVVMPPAAVRANVPERRSVAVVQPRVVEAPTTATAPTRTRNSLPTADDDDGADDDDDDDSRSRSNLTSSPLKWYGWHLLSALPLFQLTAAAVKQMKQRNVPPVRFAPPPPPPSTSAVQFSSDLTEADQQLAMEMRKQHAVKERHRHVLVLAAVHHALALAEVSVMRVDWQSSRSMLMDSQQFLEHVVTLLSAQHDVVFLIAPRRKLQALWRGIACTVRILRCVLAALVSAASETITHLMQTLLSPLLISLLAVTVASEVHCTARTDALLQVVQLTHGLLPMCGLETLDQWDELVQQIIGSCLVAATTLLGRAERETTETAVSLRHRQSVAMSFVLQCSRTVTLFAYLGTRSSHWAIRATETLQLFAEHWQRIVTACAMDLVPVLCRVMSNLLTAVQPVSQVDVLRWSCLRCVTGRLLAMPASDFSTSEGATATNAGVSYRVVPDKELDSPQHDVKLPSQARLPARF